MSVQKYVIGSKKGGYTAVPNHVIKGLKDYALIGLYLYLIHLPEGWEFHKSHLQKQGNIGRDKLDRFLARLEAHGLINMAQKRDSNGRFSHFIMDVLDGSDFKIIEIESCPQKTETPFTEKPLTENRLLVNSTYKRNINKRNKETKEIKSFCALRGQKTNKPVDKQDVKIQAAKKKGESSQRQPTRRTQAAIPSFPLLPEWTKGHPSYDSFHSTDLPKTEHESYDAALVKNRVIR